MKKQSLGSYLNKQIAKNPQVLNPSMSRMQEAYSKLDPSTPAARKMRRILRKLGKGIRQLKKGGK